MARDFVHRKTCRICGGGRLVRFLDLGAMPPANAFLSRSALKKSEKKFPLAVYFCRSCTLVQLLDVVNPGLLFHDYPYLTSASKPLADHFAELGREIRDRFLSSRNDLVVEIGSNDGALLKSIIPHARVLGVDPAVNVAELAEAEGVKTVKEFFTPAVAGNILKQEGPARVIAANNVMAHVDDLRGVLAGVNTLLSADGVFIFEAHWVGNLIGKGGFDQIYHEHLCYFSLMALKRAVEDAGMVIFDVRIVPIHGESLRVYAGKKKSAEKSVARIIAREKKLGLDDIRTFRAFAARVGENRRHLQRILRDAKKRHKRVAGYGAPGKGNTLLNYCGIDSSLLEYIVDSTPLKQGLFTPGTRIPVRHPEILHEYVPDYLLLLAWNYADVIMKREQWFRVSGGKWIIPVPRVRIM